MKYTIIKSTYPAKVVKAFKMNAGKLEKTSIANVSEGTYEVHMGSFQDFTRKVNDLNNNEVLVLGVPAEVNGTITTKKRLDSGLAGQGLISRTKDSFNWNEESAILFDIDGIENKTVDDVLRDLYKLDPALENAQKLIRYSSSSYIYSGPEMNADQEIQGLRGLHIFVNVRIPSAGDLTKYLESLKTKAWESGFGFYAISSSGSLLERFVFDASVFSPERLVFEAKSELTDVYQKDRVYGTHGSSIMLIEEVKMTKAQGKQALENKRQARDESAYKALPLRRDHYLKLGQTATSLGDKRSARLYKTKSKKVTKKEVIKPYIISCFDTVIDNNDQVHYYGDLYFDQSDWGFLETNLVDRPGQKRVSVVSRGNLEFNERARIFDIPRRTFQEISLPTRWFYERWQASLPLDEQKIDYVDVDGLEDISTPYVQENWDTFVSIIAKHTKNMLNYSGQKIQIRNERRLTDGQAASFLWAAIKKDFDFTIYDISTDDKGGVTVYPIEKDVYDAFKHVFLNSIRTVSSVIYEQRYGVDGFEVKIEGSHAIAIQQALIPSVPSEVDLPERETAEIIDWYKTYKFPEIDSLLLSSMSRLWGYKTQYYKSNTKTFEGVSNLGKDALIVEPLVELGIAITFSPSDLLGMTGKNTKMGAGNPKNLAYPITIFNEAADLKGRDSHDFLEGLKESLTGLRCNAKYEKEVIVRSKEVLLLSKMKIDAIDTMHIETLNRVIRLDNGNNSPLDNDPMIAKHSVSVIKEVIKTYIYRKWMHYYAIFESGKMPSLSLIDAELYFSWNPQQSKGEVMRSPMNEIMKALSYAYSDAHERFKHDQSQNANLNFSEFRYHSDWFAMDRSKLYIISKKSLGNMFYKEMDLSAGVLDDIIKNLKLLSEQPKTQFSALINEPDYKGGVLVKRKAAKFMINLQVVPVAVNFATLEDLLDDLLESPANFALNPVGYLTAYLTF